MSTATRELLHLAAPATFDAARSDEDALFVKGFASVETVDRSGDVVPPEEFRVEQFMAAPTLLVNHKFWIDDRGNSVAAGRPVELYAAKLAPIKGDADNWGIVDLATKKQRNTFPRAKVPNLKAGARGLFTVVAVTQPDVRAMIERGELSAFSWKGLVTVDYRIGEKGTTEKILTAIDLYEISVVNVPDNTSAPFMIGKTVCAIRLDKSRFESRGMAHEYAKTHNLRTDAMRQDDGAFFAAQQEIRDFDLEKLVSVPLSHGVNAITGPLTEEAKKRCEAAKTIGGEVLPPDEVSQLQNVLAPSAGVGIFRSLVMRAYGNG